MPRSNEYNLRHLREYRKQLRNNSTTTEKILWTRLKTKQVKGKRFRRQFSVGNYILDFFCPSEKLAVEVDGPIHFTEKAKAYDIRREAFLSKKGIRVIRFTNEEVFRKLDEVVETIADNLSD